MKPRLILASGSAIRARILEAAGVDFTIARPNVDEDAIKCAALEEGLTPRITAQRLADAKALAIDAGADAIVLGSDQILAFEGRAFDKPRSMAEARARIASLQGRRHSLINAISIARGQAIVFRHVDEPMLFMRTMGADEIDAYLNACGEEVLASVGAYQVEALGAHLFEHIEGDYFAVLGLSLFPVLGYLRREGLLAF
ncbi:MAG: Maf family protein [Pseudomonadota bacterium]